MPWQKRRINKLVVGITGSYGSGKSTVSRIFKGYGAVVLDADEIAHRTIRKNSTSYKKVLKTFGREILRRNNEIDRRRLGKIVFKNQAFLRKLNRIVHPQVIHIIKSSIKRIKGGVIILDAPLLLEAGLKNEVDILIVVNISKDKQMSRLAKKTHLGKPEILNRIKSQIPLKVKTRLADFIIDNNGTFLSLKKQTRKLMISFVRQLRTRDEFAL